MEIEISVEGVEEQSEKEVLTERQAQCLEAYRATGSASKAATALGLSTDTVREHLRSARAKLGKTSIKDLLDSRHSTNKKCATAGELMNLLRVQEYRCALSGEELTPDTAELDHKIPKSKGGDDTISNLQWLNRTVNRMKGTMTTEEFIAVCRRVAKWTS